MLERGEVANSWRRERWSSLRLLPPNWQTRLPGYRYDGADPDGFMTSAEVVEFVSGFARATAAPVRTQTTVTSVRPTDDGYHVATDTGDLECRCLVLASGACNLPSVPAFRQAVPATVDCLTPMDYRAPDQLRDGGVLVVGASATGVQLADEIHRSGRPVTLAVGEHVGCREPIAAATSCGGWLRPVSGTNATTRSTTSRAPEGYRRRNWSGHLITRRWT